MGFSHVWAASYDVMLLKYKRENVKSFNCSQCADMGPGESP